MYLWPAFAYIRVRTVHYIVCIVTLRFPGVKLTQRDYEEADNNEEVLTRDGCSIL